MSPDTFIELYREGTRKSYAFSSTNLPMVYANLSFDLEDGVAFYEY